MEDQRREEIYDGVEDYIKFARKKESVGRFSIFKKKDKIEPKPEFNDEPIEEKESQMPSEEKESQITEEIKQEAEEAMDEETEEMEEEKKIGFLSFMTNIFNRKKKKEEEEEQEKSVRVELYKSRMDEDAKRALKIADEMIKKVPNFELRKFMKSDEYELYESVMKKYGLK